MPKILPFLAAFAAAICTSTITHAGENKTPDIDGSNNGSSLKYNQNCLDIAYKNAYGTASGKPTSSSDYKNYKCYINGKVVPCTSMTEDGQTKKAEADYQTIFLQMPRQLQGKLQLLKALGKSPGLMSATSTVLLGSQQHKENLNLSQAKA